MFAIEGSFPFGRRQAAHRMSDRPHDQQEHHGRSRQEHDRQETLEAAVEQRGHAQRAPGHEIRAPDQRLDAEDALELLGLAKLARERVPRARERAGERPPNRRRDQEGQAPGRVHQHGLGQVDDRAVRRESDCGLDEHHYERDADEERVAARAPLVQVDQDRDGRRYGDPGNKPAQAQADIERAERQEAFPQEPGQPG